MVICFERFVCGKDAKRGVVAAGISTSTCSLNRKHVSRCPHVFRSHFARVIHADIQIMRASDFHAPRPPPVASQAVDSSEQKSTPEVNNEAEANQLGESHALSFRYMLPYIAYGHVEPLT